MILFYCIYTGTYCSELNKMIYLQNRRYLPMESTVREQTKGYPITKKSYGHHQQKEHIATLSNIIN